MRYAWLCHPVTVAGVVVLLLNDHLLKQTWPGFVTGKLSDVAGLVVAPPLAALLFRRRADLAATLLTGALFTLAKTTQTGAEAASHLFTLVAGPSHVLDDPTDLLALPALALAWWIRRRTLPTGSRHALHTGSRHALDAGPRRTLHTGSRRALHAGSGRARVLVTVPFAVLAVAATAGVVPPVGADRVHADDGRIVVTTDSAARGPRTAAGIASVDGGRTWRSWTGSPIPGPQETACVPGDPRRCYGVVPGRMAVRESDDGGESWRASWELSEGRRELLARRNPLPDAPKPVARALAVQQRGAGHVVVVAADYAGIAVRDVSGAWRLAGWPDGDRAADASEGPTTPEDSERLPEGPSEGPSEGLDGAEGLDVEVGPGGSERRVAYAVALVVLLGAAGAGMRRLDVAYALCAAIASAGLLYTGLNLWTVNSLLGFDLSVLFVGGGVTLLACLACLSLAGAGGATWPTVRIGLGGAVLAFAGVYGPFHGWVQGVPDRYGQAVAAAVVLTLGVVAGVTVLVRREALREDVLRSAAIDAARRPGGRRPPGDTPL
ncbi:hypothetical protein GCM10010149_55030 [Nonomuraea roseoviolacea subsp. roseoviolacea]|uniref:sialidase family protein n=1 Tax=Nonomuraea roseoviolacea TaxID=103837 RepID=UPI0031DF1000